MLLEMSREDKTTAQELLTATDGKFERQDHSPLHDVIPTHSESPSRVNEASGVGIKTTRDRIQDSKFSKSIDCNITVSLGRGSSFAYRKHTDVEHHYTDYNEINQERGRSTSTQCAAGADKESCANGATDGNHVQMPWLHGAFKLSDACAIIPLLEGLEVESSSGVEVLLSHGTILILMSGVRSCRICRDFDTLLLTRR